MRKTIVVLLILGLVVAGFSAVGMAFRGDRGEYFRQQEHRLQEEQCQILDLTEEQQEKLDELRQENLEKREELREQLREKQIELRVLLTETEAEKETDIKAVKETLLQLQEELLQLRIEHFQQMKEVFSEEQLEKIQEVMEARNTLRKHGFSRGHKGHRSFSPGSGMKY